MANDSEKHLYDDIINLPHHESENHPHMSMYNRAAQFSPFAALSGYEEAISEATRFTEQRIEISEDKKQELNYKLSVAADSIGSGAIFKFTYFIPDEKKKGGAYVTEDGVIKNIDTITGLVLLKDHTTIKINDIIEIESDIFRKA